MKRAGTIERELTAARKLRKEVEWVRSDLAYAAPEQLTRDLLLDRLNRIFTVAEEGRQHG